MVNDPAREKAELVVAAALQHKAIDPLLLKVDQLTSVTDYFFLCSGSSTRQVQALADHIVELLKKKGVRPLGVEGRSQGQWVLIDYGDVIVHLFYTEARSFYDLEGLWLEAERINVTETPAPKPKARKRKTLEGAA